MGNIWMLPDKGETNAAMSEAKQRDCFFNTSAQHRPDTPLNAAASLRSLDEPEPGGESPGPLSLGKHWFPRRLEKDEMAVWEPLSLQLEEKKPPIVLLCAVVAAVIVPTFLSKSLVQMLWFFPLGLVAWELKQWETPGKTLGISPCYRRGSCCFNTPESGGELSWWAFAGSLCW